MVRHKQSDILDFRILIKTFRIREKITEKWRGIPTKRFITQQRKVIESSNWYQIIAIAMVIF